MVFYSPSFGSWDPQKLPSIHLSSPSTIQKRCCGHSGAFSVAFFWTLLRYSICLLCHWWKSFCHAAHLVLNHLSFEKKVTFWSRSKSVKTECFKMLNHGFSNWWSMDSMVIFMVSLLMKCGVLEHNHQMPWDVPAIEDCWIVGERSQP